MNIGKRLYELRQAKGLSQNDIEHRTGLMLAYTSRIEDFSMVSSLEALRKCAIVLELEPFQLFFTGEGKPYAAKGTGLTHTHILCIKDEKALATIVTLQKQARRMAETH